MHTGQWQDQSSPLLDELDLHSDLRVRLEKENLELKPSYDFSNNKGQLKERIVYNMYKNKLNKFHKNYFVRICSW